MLSVATPVPVGACLTQSVEKSVASETLPSDRLAARLQVTFGVAIPLVALGLVFVGPGLWAALRRAVAQWRLGKAIEAGESSVARAL